MTSSDDNIAHRNHQYLPIEEALKRSKEMLTDVKTKTKLYEESCNETKSLLMNSKKKMSEFNNEVINEINDLIDKVTADAIMAIKQTLTYNWNSNRELYKLEKNLIFLRPF